MSFAYDLIGLVGAGFIIVAYFLLQIKKLDASGWRYSTMNMLGAGLIIISLLVEWNFAAFVIEAFWLGISLFGLAKYIAQKKRPA
jgi:hypothetical protein